MIDMAITDEAHALRHKIIAALTGEPSSVCYSALMAALADVLTGHAPTYDDFEHCIVGAKADLDKLNEIVAAKCSQKPPNLVPH